MRILHICAYSWATGGPPKVIFDHAEITIRQGHAVTILSPISPGEVMYPVPTGATLVTVPRWEPVSRFFREFAPNMVGYLRTNRNQFDVIHMHGLWHFGVLLPFLVGSSAIRVITVHGVLDRWALRSRSWKKELMSALFQKRFLRQADLVHVLTDEEAADVRQHVGQDLPRLVVVPNGVRTVDFANLPVRGTFRQQLGLPLTVPIVLFMSRLNRKKGLELLLPAFAAYLRQQPNTLLLLAGGDDGYEAEARAFIDQHQLSDHIKLVGMLTGETKRAALADADVFVLTSFSEGFSMAVLEAMAAGLPALVSDRVGFADTIRQYQAAHIADLTETSILDGLTALLSNTDYRAGLSQRAKTLVQSQYDIETVAGQLLACYVTALAHRNPASISAATTSAA